MKTYLVGGAVRDLLLNKTPNDKDYIVVNSSKKEMLNKGFIKNSLTFSVFLHPQTKDEYALARTEEKIGKGYSEFKTNYQNVSLEEDLKRRDLTINAIALDENNNYIDPFNGIDDIKNKILKPVSNKFKEDPVRALRLARFYCQLENFTISQECFSLVKEMKNNNELKYLKPNQIRDELEKALLSKKPSLFFYALKDLNILEDIIPLIFNLIDVPQVVKYHPEGCSFTHSMIVLDKARSLSSDLKVLYACLLHDLGKGITPKDILPKHIGHEKAGVPLVSQFCKELQLPRSIQSFCELFCEEHLRIHKILVMTPKKIISLIKRLRILNDDEKLNNLIICAKSDELGKLKNEYPQGDFLKKAVKSLKQINKKEIAKIYPNREQEEIHQRYIKTIKDLKS